MRFGSVCSGIEAASVAWLPLGWRPVFFSEIEAFPCAVLKARHPGVPNFGDMTKFQEWPDAAIDVLVGGTPCQSFSVAGLRGGLDDARGNLMLTFAAIARRYRPGRLVWENVPGVLSSNGGRDFASLLGLLSGRAVIAPADGWKNSGVVPGIESAYGLAWRVLDAQFFGVPQRRRRVFVVGCLGDWRRAAAVLFERSSLRGDPAPRRKAGERPAPTISARTQGGGGLGTDFDCDGGLIAAQVAPTLSGSCNKTGGDRPFCTQVDTAESFICMSSGQANAELAENVSTTLTTLHEAPIVAQAFKASHVAPPLLADADKGDNDTLVCAIQERAVCENPDAGPDGAGFRDDGQAYTLEARTVPKAVAFGENVRGEIRTMEVTDALSTGGGKPGQGYAAAQIGMQVRRLTPRECERLQGFPDDYTLIPVRGKPAADGPRYKALGNSMAVPVMRWIGSRIDLVDNLARSEAA